MRKFKTLCFIAITACTVLFTACGGGANTPDSSMITIDADGTYANTQPYATQGYDGWETNACGGFSMAYYFAEKGRISANEVKNAAQNFYNKIKFDSSLIDGIINLINSQGGGGDDSESLNIDPSDLYFADFSDPLKIRNEMAAYVYNSELRMVTDPKGSSDATQALAMLAYFIIPTTEQTSVTFINNIEEELDDDEYVIEIVISNPPATDGVITVDLDNPFNNYFHYLLTYWKTVNGVKELYTLDPYQGEEKPRSYFDNTVAASRSGHPDETYLFCEGGVFITPENPAI